MSVSGPVDEDGDDLSKHMSLILQPALAGPEDGGACLFTVGQHQVSPGVGMRGLYRLLLQVILFIKGLCSKIRLARSRSYRLYLLNNCTLYEGSTTFQKPTIVADQRVKLNIYHIFI
jgi:hypothetical protein